MSVMRMVVLAAERKEQEGKVFSLATAGEEKPGAAVTSAMDKISADIPSEVIGLYVAGFGIFAPGSRTAKWAIFFVCLVFIPVLTVLGAMAARRKGLPVPGAKATAIVIGVAVVMFAAWCSAMPDTPFLVFGAEATRIGGFVVLALGCLIPKLAEALDIHPKRN